MNAPLGAHLLRADSRLTRARGWYRLLTPSDPTTALNEVIHSSASAEEADARIEAVIGEHEAAGVPLKWLDWPPEAGLATIPELAARLARRGFRSWEACAMARDVERLPISAEVTRVDAASLGAWASVLSEGWAQPLEGVLDDTRRALALPERRAFLVHVDGQVAGTATTILQGESAYLSGAVVLPAFRRRGLYRALVAARLNDLADEGIPLATTHARPGSARVLEPLGFRTLLRYRCWANDPTS